MHQSIFDRHSYGQEANDREDNFTMDQGWVRLMHRLPFNALLLKSNEKQLWGEWRCISLFLFTSPEGRL